MAIGISANVQPATPEWPYFQNIYQ